MIRRSLIAFVALLAVLGGALGTLRPASASGPAYDSIVFVPAVPIAQPGTLTGSQTQTILVHPEQAGNRVPGAEVFLSIVTLYQTGPGGSATVGSTPLTATPQLFTANSSGDVTVVYTAPASRLTIGRDVITAQNTAVTPTVTNSDTYVFSPVDHYVWSTGPGNPPFAPGGSLAAGQSVTFTVMADDSTNHGVPGAFLDLSLTATASAAGSATATNALNSPPTRVLSGTPSRVSADSNGTVSITYTAPNPLPTSGTVFITAQDHPTSTVTGQTTYSFEAFVGKQSLGDGPLGGNPKAVAASPGHTFVFWKGTDNTLWYAWYGAGGWHGPGNLGGHFAPNSSPHPVMTGNGTIDVFWTGVDGNLWHVYEINGSGSFAAPQSLGGGPLGSDPQPASSGRGDVAVFWKGTDNNLWAAMYKPGAAWRVPVFLGSGPMGGVSPHAAAFSANSYDVFWRGTDNNVWHNYTVGGGWSGPQGLGMGPLGGDPIAISPAIGVVDLFWQGTDHGLWHGWYQAGWHGPQGYGGSVYSEPSPIVPLAGQVDAFWRTATGDIQHLSGGVPTSLGDSNLKANAVPSAMSWGSNHEEVFWWGSDDALWHDWAN